MNLSLPAIVMIGAAIFTLLFYAGRKKILRRLYTLPSVVMLGSSLSGKSTMIHSMTNQPAVPHRMHKNIHVSYHDNGVQFVEPQNYRAAATMKNANCRSMVYVFDVSKFSPPINDQVRKFGEFQKMFRNVNYITVANKMDIGDRKKIATLRKNFPSLHETSFASRKGVDKLKNSIYSSMKEN